MLNGKCIFWECDEPATMRKTYCNAHYRQMLRAGGLRPWKRPKKWEGALCSNGDGNPVLYTGLCRSCWYHASHERRKAEGRVRRPGTKTRREALEAA